MSHNEATSAICFRGGGFLSVASQSGLVAGFLAANSRKHNGAAPTTLTGSGMMDQYELISAVSGGSWFSCELIYSRRFLKLIESMAFTPETAGAQFDADWIDGWLSISKGNPLITKVAASLAKVANDPVLQQTILEVGYFLNTGFDWNNFARTVLRTTADIDGDAPLGSSVLDWAEGKVWLVGVTQVLPTGTNGLNKVAVFPPGGSDMANSKNFASYKAALDSDNSVEFPAYVPARFNYKLGSGQDSSAPVPYVASDVVPPSTVLSYSGAGSGTSIFDCCRTYAFSGKTEPLGRFNNFNYFPGYLPVGDVVACSSSFLGDIAALPSSGSGLDPFEQLAIALNGDLSTWAGNGPHEKGLSEATAAVREVYKSGVHQNSFDNLKQNAVLCTIDGGFTDTTGIANAVAAGATQIVAFLNLTDTDQPAEPTALFDLFASQLTERAAGEFVGCKKRFMTARDTDTGASTESFSAQHEIFSQTQEDVRQRYAELSATQSMTIPTGSRTQLISIVAGTLSDLTTKDEPFFGVKGNRTVQLHFVCLTSKLNMGQFVDFHDYSVLVQEIMDTLLDDANKSVVEGVALPFLFPEAKDVHQQSKPSKQQWSLLGA